MVSLWPFNPMNVEGDLENCSREVHSFKVEDGAVRGERTGLHVEGQGFDIEQAICLCASNGGGAAEGGSG